MQTEHISTAGRRISLAQTGWLAGALIVPWLGVWVHEFWLVPAQFDFTLDGALFHLLPAVIIFLAWWRFPQHLLPISGFLVLGTIRCLGAFSVLPLPFLSFVPEQTVSHYLVHGIYLLAQLPLLMVALMIMRRRHARRGMASRKARGHTYKHVESCFWTGSNAAQGLLPCMSAVC
jgi:hypothetical protein